MTKITWGNGKKIRDFQQKIFYKIIRKNPGSTWEIEKSMWSQKYSMKIRKIFRNKQGNLKNLQISVFIFPTPLC